MARRHGNALPADIEIDGYRILSYLNEGGFGITYRALDIKLDSLRVIKEYMPRHIARRAADGTTVQPIADTDEEAYQTGLVRFEQEGRALGYLDHPNIVQVYRCFEANGTAYLVMKFVEGEDLKDRLDREGPMNEPMLRGMVAALLDGLETLHDAGFLHRDIKPSNILIGSGDRPLLIDFGAARQVVGEMTRSLTPILTPGYAPAEQYDPHGNQGPWTDIYALGATIYCAATGSKPPDVHSRLPNDAYVPLAKSDAGSFSPEFRRAVDWSLNTEIRDRPQSVASWRTAFGLDGGSKAVRYDRSRGSSSPRPIAVKGAAAVLCILMIGLGGGYWIWSGERDSRRPAPARAGSSAKAGTTEVEGARRSEKARAAEGETQRRNDARKRREAAERQKIEDTRRRRQALARRVAPRVTWERVIGGVQRDYARSVLVTAGGNAVVAATTWSTANGKPNIRILQFDPGGKARADRTYAGEHSAIVAQIAGLSDGGVVVSGTIRTMNEKKHDIWLLRLGRAGELVWKWKYGIKGRARASSITVLRDGGLALGGWAELIGTKERFGFVLRLDSRGRNLWQYRYRNGKTVLTDSVAAHAQGGVVAAGLKIEKDETKQNVWVRVLDSGKQLIWERTLGGRDNDRAGSVVSLPDGGVVVAGCTWINTGRRRDLWLVRLDRKGKTLWKRTYGGEKADCALSVVALPNSDLLAAGYTLSKGAGLRDGWLLRLDPNGRKLWDRTLGGARDDSIRSVAVFPDGGVIVAGLTYSKGAGLSDIWVARLDVDGRIPGSTVK